MEHFCHTDVRLLSRCEWEQFLATIPNIPVESKTPWWVNEKNGYIDRSGNFKEFTFEGTVSTGVRPLFEAGGFALAGHHPGDKITIGNIQCTVVIYERRHVPYIYALADDIVGYAKHDNVYEFFKTEEFNDLVYNELPI